MKAHKRHRQAIINSNVSALVSFLEENEMYCKDVSTNKNEFNRERIDTSVQGLKVEYHIQQACFRVGFGAGEENVEAIYDALLENYDESEIIKKPKFIDVLKCDLEDFKEFLEILENVDLPADLVKPFGFVSNKAKSGVSFANTDHAPYEGERSNVMSGLGEKRVLEALSDPMIDRDNRIVEKPTDLQFNELKDGRIDALYTDKKGYPYAIIECMSGISYGDSLDYSHLNKTLNDYPYGAVLARIETEEGYVTKKVTIIDSLKKIVIIAGNYMPSQLEYISRRSKELSFLGIEVVVLKTIKIKGNKQDEIHYQRVEY